MRTEIPDNIEVNPEITFEEIFETLRNDRGRALFFDIETMPADNETLTALFEDEEIELPKYPGVFDASKVKYGNTKDPEKRQAKLNEEMAKHNQALASWDDDCKQAREEAWKKFLGKSTLSVTAGRIAAIGYGLRCDKEVRLLLDVRPTDERSMLLNLWKFVALVRKRNHKLVSFNGWRFDLPFCVRRSWAYTDVTPPVLINKYNKYEENFVDALAEYRMGGPWTETIKLDHLARMMGVRRKLEGMTGDRFWQVLEEDEEKALNYLAGDIYCLADVAERMQLA